MDLSVAVSAAPVREQVFQNIKRAIEEEHFEEGRRLVERELCELTGASRTAVREALRQLESDGLITVIPNRGVFVAILSVKETQDMYEVRMLLEGRAARLFAQNATAEQIKALGTTVEALTNAYSLGNSRAILRAKKGFYDVILAGCGNTFIGTLLNALHTRIARLWSTSLGQPGRPAESLKEIVTLLKTLEARDAVAAEKASNVHVENASRVALAAIQNARRKDAQKR